MFAMCESLPTIVLMSWLASPGTNDRTTQSRSAIFASFGKLLPNVTPGIAVWISPVALANFFRRGHLRIEGFELTWPAVEEEEDDGFIGDRVSGVGEFRTGTDLRQQPRQRQPAEQPATQHVENRVDPAEPHRQCAACANSEGFFTTKTQRRHEGRKEDKRDKNQNKTCSSVFFVCFVRTLSFVVNALCLISKSRGWVSRRGKCESGGWYGPEPFPPDRHPPSDKPSRPSHRHSPDGQSGTPQFCPWCRGQLRASYRRRRTNRNPHCGQWSRPARAFTFGVRPMSPVTTTSVLSSRPRSVRSSMSADSARSRNGSNSFFSMLKLLSCVSQWPFGFASVWIVTNVTPASTSRREQYTLAEDVAAVAVTEFFWFTRKVECGFRLG